MFSIIFNLKKQGKTILIVEQNVNQTLHIADRGYILETGKITLQDQAQKLLKNDYIKKAYLGI
jgi:branched-chain amino acid transport system ATP-binding protein